MIDTTEIEKKTHLKKSKDYTEDLCTIGDVIDMQSGVAFKKSEYSHTGVRLFQIANVSFNYIKWDEVEFLPEDYVNKYPELLLKDGDIVMALNRPLLNDQLKIAQLKSSDTPAILYQRVGRFKFLREDNHRYFLYFLQSPAFITWLKSQLQGVNIPFINKSKLLGYNRYPNRTPKEQQQVVSKIEELFSEVEKGIEEIKTVRQQLKVYRQAVLKWAFEGRLTNKNVTDGELPKGWKWEKLGNVAEKKSTKALPAEYPNSKFIGMDCIEPHTLQPYFLYDFKDFKSAGNLFKTSQVLYGRMRPYLNKVYRADFDGVCSGEFIILDCGEIFHPDLLKYILHSRGFVRFANSITTGDRPRISYEEIADYDIPLPPPTEQQQIVQEIESRLSVCDTIEETIANSLKQAEALRQSILKKAFEGKLIKF